MSALRRLGLLARGGVAPWGRTHLHRSVHRSGDSELGESEYGLDSLSDSTWTGRRWGHGPPDGEHDAEIDSADLATAVDFAGNAE